MKCDNSLMMKAVVYLALYFLVRKLMPREGRLITRITKEMTTSWTFLPGTLMRFSS